MTIYRIYAVATVSKFLGEVEADSIEEAKDKGFSHDDCHMMLCHQCARDVELGDIYEIQAEEA